MLGLCDSVANNQVNWFEKSEVYTYSTCYISQKHYCFELVAYNLDKIWRWNSFERVRAVRLPRGQIFHVKIQLKDVSITKGALSQAKTLLKMLLCTFCVAKKKMMDMKLLQMSQIKTHTQKKKTVTARGRGTTRAGPNNYIHCWQYISSIANTITLENIKSHISRTQGDISKLLVLTSQQC